MFRSLRNRLILSHILPLLIILPLMGIGLITILETQVYLPALSNELENDARLIARLTRPDGELWRNAARAQEMVQLYSTRNNARIMLLDANGEILASSDPEDQARLGQALAGVDFAAIRKSTTGVARQIHYIPRQGTEVIDIIVPVNAETGPLLGFVRVSYPFASLNEEIYQLRFFIFLLLGLGLLIGSVVGYILAVSVSNPVREVTQAISALANNSQMKLLPVYGPEEIQLLTGSVNNLVTRLRELEQARRQLLANLMHEIGRPLGALRSAITALMSGAEKDRGLYDDLLRGMDGETEQLQRLLNDLSGLHDQVLGTLELERRPIDLKAWLVDHFRGWQAASLEKDIQWKLNLPEVLPKISADPTRLAQILGNLTHNAIKFTPPGGMIEISAVASAGQVGITVRDSGPGMSMEEQKQIFQPFFRGTHGRRFPQGMGLGLSIARDLTEAHGGHLLLESTVGKGSQFTVWLPAEVS